MEFLWRPRGVAVIGASDTPGSVGNRVLAALLKHGYAGAVYPVNPRLTTMAGLDCLPSVHEAPGPVDLALVAVSAERTKAVLAACAEKGVGYAVLFSSGFGETGAPGQALEAELVAFARQHGIRLLGPNCIGLVNTGEHLVAGFSPLFERMEFARGTIGLVAQSGALGFGIASLLMEKGHHLSKIITTGNEADLSAAELVRALLLDDQTHLVLVYAEGLKAAPLWREIGALSRQERKPVLILKAGRSTGGARAATSHTAAMAGDDVVWDAAFRQLGLLRVDDIEEMLDLAAGLATPFQPAGNRVGVLTTSGGAGILATDALERMGLQVPSLAVETRAALAAIVPSFGSIANPVDVTATVIGNPGLFRRALEALARDPNVDLMIVCFCVLQGEDAVRLVDDLLVVRAESGKPIIVSRTGAEGLAPEASERLQWGRVPVYRSPARAARVAVAMAQFRAGADGKLPVLALAAAPLPGSGPAPAGWPVQGGQLSERAVKSLLRAEGLPVTREIPASTPEEAVDAAAQIGYPVVLKLDSAVIAHKSEVGGVKLNLVDAAAVWAAALEIQTSVPGADLLVQEMVTDVVAEVLVGVTPSPIGPVITVGLGGLLTEVWQDVTRRLAPLSAAEALEMLQELKLWRVLNLRGRPAADIGALTKLIARVSELAVTWPGSWELDLNPVLALPTGCVIADGLLVVEEGRPC